MRIGFYGAAGEVTGSCYLVQTDRARILVDFGLHQGGGRAERRNRRFPPIDAPHLDAVLMTHAHLDHCGRMPLLGGAGYKGPIFSTAASCDLAELILRDSAHIQETDAERDTRRRARRGRPPVRPLYRTSDVEAILGTFETVEYDKPVTVAKGITARYVDAGHILGSASIELTIEEGGSAPKTVVFSGDIGEKGSPLLRDPTALSRADVVLMESTYGDRDHKPAGPTVDELAELLGKARVESDSVLIPSFAVGRTQQLIYYMGILQRHQRLRSTEVYIDSPMAITATELYRRHREVFDEKTWSIINAGDTPLNFSGLHMCRTADESRSLNAMLDGIAIIAASGMCTGGRILHHLKHRLWRSDTHVVFVGYQAEGTLGRRIVEGAKSVRVMGEPIAVKAQVHTLGGFSAHAGQSGLIEWAGHFRDAAPRFILTHGEDKPRSILAGRLRGDFGYEVAEPQWRETMTV